MPVTGGAVTILQLSGFCLLFLQLILSLKTIKVCLTCEMIKKGMLKPVCKWEWVHMAVMLYAHVFCLSLVPIWVRLCMHVWMHSCRKTCKGVGVTGQHLEKAHKPQRQNLPSPLERHLSHSGTRHIQPAILFWPFTLPKNSLLFSNTHYSPAVCHIHSTEHKYKHSDSKTHPLTAIFLCVSQAPVTPSEGGRPRAL